MMNIYLDITDYLVHRKKMHDSLLLSKVEMYVKKTPEKIALIMEGNEISYRQLFSKANTLALLFRSCGIQEDRLAVHLPNSIELAIVYLASLMAGVVIVPLSIELKHPEIMRIFLETTPVAFIGNTRSYPFFNDFSFEKTSLKHIFSLDEKPPLPFQTLKITSGKFKKNAFQSPNNPAAIFYTSGSTSKPKGIVHSQRSLTAMMDSMVDALDLDLNGRFLMSEPMSNCSGYVQSLLPLLIGATTIIMPFFSIEAFKDAIQYLPTRMSLMGDGNHKIIETSELASKHFTGITLNLTGGDRISEELVRAFKDKTGIPLRLAYGMSECLLIAVNKDELAGTVGQVAKNTTIQLRDQKLNPTIFGKEGEVWIKGPNCMLGYWKNTELTNKTIIDGWLRTGDLAYCDEKGFYWFLGRLKNLIIRNGDNISPFEIEEVLTKHPAVLSAGVIGVSHSIEGEVPNAFVELKKGQKVSQKALFSFIKNHLEDDKLPTKIFILNKLPRTENGKIARKKLKEFIL